MPVRKPALLRKRIFSKISFIFFSNFFGAFDFIPGGIPGPPGMPPFFLSIAATAFFIPSCSRAARFFDEFGSQFFAPVFAITSNDPFQVETGSVIPLTLKADFLLVAGMLHKRDIVLLPIFHREAKAQSGSLQLSFCCTESSREFTDRNLKQDHLRDPIMVYRPGVNFFTGGWCNLPGRIDLDRDDNNPSYSGMFASNATSEFGIELPNFMVAQSCRFFHDIRTGSPL